ncbi:MAG: ankyrin repeat domain-containing protein [Myxococcota bacterium]
MKLLLNILILGFALFQMGSSCESELNRIVPDPHNYPLHSAVKFNRMEEVRKLIEQDGISANSSDNNRNTPMHIAAYQGDISMIKYLASKGADLNARDAPKGRTPLHVAAAQSHWLSGYQDVINTLIELGADVHAVDNDKKQTALHRAAYWLKEENVEALIAKGANPHARNSQNRTPCDEINDRWSAMTDRSRETLRASVSKIRDLVCTH